MTTGLLVILSLLPAFAAPAPKNPPPGGKVINGIDYLPLARVVSGYGGRCFWTENNRFIVLIPNQDSLPAEYLFIVDSARVLHNNRALKLPLPPVKEGNQLYLPAVVVAGMFPELDVPVLSAIETDREKDTIIIRLMLNPIQKRSAPFLFHKEKRSSMEFRLTLGCRTDSGFAPQLRLLSLTAGNTLLNGVELDTTVTNTHLVWLFRAPVQETVIARQNLIEVRITPRPPRRVTKILIDPGHGGKDPGAIGQRGTEEKTVVLDIARRLKKYLTQQGFTVIMTRESDEYVTLAQRAEMATKSGADLFISIHANAAPNRSASGVETYFLSEAKTDWERAVAARENAVFERELTNPLIKENNPLSLILADLAQNEFLFESSELATHIQEAMLPAAGTGDRGVRQANFYVLRNTFMPAVLVECGYLSNRQEEKKLRTPEHRDKIARAIAKGAAEFARIYERRLNGNHREQRNGR